MNHKTSFPLKSIFTKPTTNNPIKIAVSTNNSITSMKEVSEQLRKLRRQYLRYQQAEIIYSISHKKLFELASDAGAIYRIDGTVWINRDIFDAYLEQFHELATGKDKVVYGICT